MDCAVCLHIQQSLPGISSAPDTLLQKNVSFMRLIIIDQNHDFISFINVQEKICYYCYHYYYQTVTFSVGYKEKSVGLSGKSCIILSVPVPTRHSVPNKKKQQFEQSRVLQGLCCEISAPVSTELVNIKTHFYFSFQWPKLRDASAFELRSLGEILNQMSGGISILLSLPAEGGSFSPSFLFPDSSDHEDKSWSYQRHVSCLKRRRRKTFANLCISQLNRNERISCFRAVTPLCTSYFKVIVFFLSSCAVTSVAKNKIFLYGFHRHVLIEYNNAIYNICCSYIVFTYVLGVMAFILPFMVLVGNCQWKGHFRSPKFVAYSVFSKADEILNALYLLTFFRLD